MRDNTGVSLTLNKSSPFASEMIRISRGIAMTLTGNPFWKTFDRAVSYALLKMHAFICHFVHLQRRIFTLRFGFHSEFVSYIPNNLNYLIRCTSNQPLAHFPVLVSCNSVFPFSSCRFTWAMLSSRNFKFLYRLHGGL